MAAIAVDLHQARNRGLLFAGNGIGSGRRETARTRLGACRDARDHFTVGAFGTR
jgi:hypothetical protein